MIIKTNVNPLDQIAIGQITKKKLSRPAYILYTLYSLASIFIIAQYLISVCHLHSFRVINEIRIFYEIIYT